MILSDFCVCVLGLDLVLCPDPPESRMRVWCCEGLFLSHGVVEQHKECNYCILHTLHAAASVLDLVLDCYVITYNYAFC